MPSKSAGRSGGASASAWNLKEICELIDVLVERQISEFEMEKGGVRIRIKRGNASAEPAAAAGFVNSAPPAWSSVPPPSPPLPSPGPAEPVVGLEPSESTEGVHIIKSPIVGTFYASPAPTAPPFVQVGDVVQVGQPLCIIEAMKLMNEIESEVAGEVVRAYVENGQPVEYGQSLFAIKPSHKK
jgi:acetyl-CoA carboxylase biotin carboxyl carrier protein